MLCCGRCSDTCVCSTVQPCRNGRSTGGGYKFELQNPQDGVIYGLFQIFSGEFGHDDTTGQPVFLDGVDYVYGESHPDAGQPISVEAKQQYLNDNSGYLDSIINQLKPIAILSVENPTYECGEGVYLWARAASESTGGGTGSTGGSETGGDGTGSGSVDIIWTDIEDAVVTNPSISGEKVDGVYSLTVEKPAAGHRYKVYQIYTGDVNGNGRNLSNVKYGSNYGETGSSVPASELNGIEDAKEFARKITSEGTVYGEPVAVLTEDSPTQELPAGYYLVIDESDGDMENDAISDFVVAIVGTTKFTPKSTSVPKFDKVIDCGTEGFPDNVLAVQEGTTEITAHQYENTSGKTAVYIPATVTKIGAYAFAGCEDVEYFYFEDGSCLESIDEYAFYGCHSIRNFIIPKNETLDCISVGQCAWFDCTALETIYVPCNYKEFMDNVAQTIFLPPSSGQADTVYPEGQSPSPTIYFKSEYTGIINRWDIAHVTPWWDIIKGEKADVAIDKYKETVGWDELNLNGSEDADTSVQYGTNQSVPFELSAVIPQAISAYDKYQLTFHDTLSDGLTYDEGSMKVFVGDAEVDSSAYSVTFNGQQFTVEIADAKAEPFNAVPGSRIYVRYSTTLNDVAVFRNINNAWLEYSNNPNGEGTGTTVSDDVTAFTFTMDIDKVDKDGNELAGAGFTLYKKAENGETDTEDGYVKIGDEVTGGSSFTFTGLAVGDYKLVESTTPDGYNTMEDLEFSVVADSTEDADGNAYVTGLKIVVQGGTLDSDMIEGWTADTDTGMLSADIANYRGSELPSTGGMGTATFYVTGGCIMAMVCFMLVKRKEKYAE